MNLDSSLLEQIALEHGTPVYVYDLDWLEARIAKLAEVLPGALVRYAAKANSSGVILRTVARAGHGAEVITEGELQRALASGIPGGQIILGGPAQQARLREQALQAGVATVSLDSESQWDDWQETLATAGTAHKPGFLVRVNPDLDPHTHQHLATGAGDSKFGLDARSADRLAGRVRAADVFSGFHVHAGSQIADLNVFRGVLSVLGPLCDEHRGSIVNLGGGYSVPGFPLEEYAQLVRDFAASHSLTLMVEPGRWLVAQAGVLLTRVLHVKPGPVTHVIADAGMADLLRPALYGAEHPLQLVGDVQDRKLRIVDVDGPLCENSDRLARNRELPEPAKGDLLQVGEAGAYGIGMASNYASSLRPAGVAVKDGVPRLIRKRETPADLLRDEVS